MFSKALRRGRQSSSMESPPRMSILPISLPSLRWWDGDKAPTNNKSPLLSLKLSSHTFLDSSVKDDQSATVVYTIKTRNAYTAVLRCDGKEDYVKIAMIKWPGALSNEGRDDYNSLLIKMKGLCWSDGQMFLSSGLQSECVHDSSSYHVTVSNACISNSSSRKFTIPDYAHAIKWKRYGTSYWVSLPPTQHCRYILTGKQCTTPGVKGAIAILDLARGLEPMRLIVYETFHDKYDPQALSTYQGVSLLLLDYLIVTALLSATDVTAWMHLKRVDMAARQSVDSGDDSYFLDLPNHPYGMALEELRNTASEISLTSTFTDVPPSLTGFHRRLESYANRMPASIESDTLSSARCSFGSMAIEEWSKDYWEFLHGIRPTSSTESLQCHTLPSGRGSQYIPPVPPLPSQFVKSLSGSRAGTSSSRRDLPCPPDQPRTPNQSIFSSYVSPRGLEEGRSSERPLNSSRSTHVIKRSETLRRPLPKPPTESGIRRIQSSAQLTDRSSTKTHARRMRSLPATPVMKSSAVEPSSSVENRAAVAEGNSHLHAQVPLMTKVSQDDFSKWVNVLTNPERALPSPPLSESVVFEMPPPSYASIYLAQRAKQHIIPTST